MNKLLKTSHHIYFDSSVFAMKMGIMSKETRLKKTFNNAVENTIKRFSKLEANDRYALSEEMGEWVIYIYLD